jgi:hypothetical protein
MFTGDTFKVINNIYNKYYNFKKIQVSQGLHCTTEGFNIVLPRIQQSPSLSEQVSVLLPAKNN